MSADWMPAVFIPLVMVGPFVWGGYLIRRSSKRRMRGGRR